MKDWRKSPEPAGMMGQAPSSSSTHPTTTHTNTHEDAAGSSSWASTNPADDDPTARTRGGRGGGRSNLSLADLARRVIIQRIHMFDTFGDTPFALVRPILEQCSAKKLWMLEEESPDYIEHTDYIWKRNCMRDFKDLQQAMTGKSAPTEYDGVWREVYRDRMVADFEAKQAAAAKIKQKYAMLKADKAANQVRIVERMPPVNRRAYNRPAPLGANATQGQRMLSKARRQASTFTVANKAASRSHGSASENVQNGSASSSSRSTSATYAPIADPGATSPTFASSGFERKQRSPTRTDTRPQSDSFREQKSPITSSPYPPPSTSFTLKRKAAPIGKGITVQRKRIATAAAVTPSSHT